MKVCIVAPNFAALRLPALVLLTFLSAACDGGATSAEPPSAPTGFSAETASSTSIELSWSAEGDAAAFQLERAGAIGAFEPLTTVSAGARAYTDTRLEPDAAYRYRISACDDDLCSATLTASARTLKLLAIGTTTLPTATAGATYEQTIGATGGDGSYTWDITAGSLPQGLSLETAGGAAVLSGTPTAEGSYTFTLRARSGDDQAAQVELTLQVTPEPPPAPTNLAAGQATMTAIPLSWSAGEDPDSFELERTTGVLANFEAIATLPGTARGYTDSAITPGITYRYRVRSCVDGVCSAYSATVTILTPAPLQIITDTLDIAVIGTAYTDGVIATGGDGNLTWEIVAGTLPAGLALSKAEFSQNAIISGTPEGKETATFTVGVRSGDGQTDQKELTLAVRTTAPVTIETVWLPVVVAEGPYNVLLQAAGGDGENYDWSVDSGALPPGLAIVGDSVQGNPQEVGSFDVTIRVTSGDRAYNKAFTVRVVPQSTGRYDITAYPIADIPDDIQPHVDDAIARWEEALTGDLSPAAFAFDEFEPGGCFGFGDALNGTSLDDIIMLVNIDSIDGRGSVIGQAGPCAVRGGSRLPLAGVLTLDVADLQARVGTDNLTDLIFHEMGHILGFGTLWGGLRTATDTDSVSFTGERAVEEWRSLGRTGNVPVEATGGEGTKNSHWRESVFGNEVMTGFTEAVGVFQPLSRVTIASMADLGYAVDLGVADSFSLYAAIMAGGGTAREHGWDVVLTAPPRVLRDNQWGRTFPRQERAPDRP